MIKMKEQLMHSWWLIGLSVLTSVAGQTVIKVGVGQPKTTTAMPGLYGLVATIFTSPLILFGLVLYGIGALAWIAVLARLNLSFAYPLLALNFVLIAIISRFFLGEAIPTMRWLGIAVICAGILVVARSNLGN
jgi:multidrug transporter EmrE-like cation transporter